MIEAGQLPTLSTSASLRRREQGMSRLAKIGDWFEQRLKIGGDRPRDDDSPCASPIGQLVLRLRQCRARRFYVQIFTGIMLALIYVPSAGEAWNSLQYLNHGVTLGWYLRAVHGWGSNFMVAIVLIHMVQVALFGAYKFPRELTWIVGVFLLLMTLGMAFTGQVLRFDQDAYWGLGIGASICGRVPFIGAGSCICCSAVRSSPATRCRASSPCTSS